MIDQNEGPQAFDRVIRTFSDAEVALREIAHSADRIRSASGSMEATRETLSTTAMELRDLAGRLAELASAMAESNAQIKALEPDRLWAAIDGTKVALGRNADEVATRAASVGAAIVDVRRQVVIVRWLVLLTLLVAMGSIVASYPLWKG